MNPEIASQLVETTETVAKTSAAIAAYGGAAHAVTTIPAIDYSSPAVLIPLTVAAIAGVYHLLLIYKVAKEIKSK